MPTLNGDLLIEVAQNCMHDYRRNPAALARMLLIGGEMSAAFWDVMRRCRRFTQHASNTFVVEWNVPESRLVLSVQTPLHKLMRLVAVANAHELVLRDWNWSLDEDFLAAIVANRKLKSLSLSDSSVMFEALRHRSVSRVALTSNSLHRIGNGHFDKLTLDYANVRQLYAFKGSVDRLVICHLDYLPKSFVPLPHNPFASTLHLAVEQAIDQRAYLQLLQMCPNLRSASFSFEKCTRSRGRPIDHTFVDRFISRITQAMQRVTVPEVTVRCVFWTQHTFLSNFLQLPRTYEGDWNTVEERALHVLEGEIPLSPNTRLHLRINIRKTTIDL